MIYCCGDFFAPQRVIFLVPNERYKDRELQILICPICGKLSAVLTQYNIKTGKTDVYRPRRKETSRFLIRLEAQEKRLKEVKYCTKENAGFVYGVNVEGKDGRIYQYAVDFNGTRKLVKII